MRVRANLGQAEDIEPFLKGIRKIVPADLMPASLKALEARYLGCGSFGCAYRAKRKGWVIKVTEDVKEATFAFIMSGLAASTASRPRSQRDITAGLIEYGGVVQLLYQPRRSPPTWLVWREEAFRVGNLKDKDRPCEDLITLYDNYIEEAVEHFRGFTYEDQKKLQVSVLKYMNRKRVKGYLGKLAHPSARQALMNEVGRRCIFHDEPYSPSLNDLLMDMVHEGLRTAVTGGLIASAARDVGLELVRARLLLNASAVLAEEEARFSGMKGIIRTLSFLAERGIYLMDLREDNLGYAKRGKGRGLVMTDPRPMVIGTKLSDARKTIPVLKKDK